MSTLTSEEVAALAHRVSVIVRSVVSRQDLHDDIKDQVRVVLWMELSRRPGWRPPTTWIKTVTVRATHHVARVRSRERPIAGSEEFMIAQAPAAKSIGAHEARRLLQPLARQIRHALTRRQRRAYRLVMRGCSCRQIARLCGAHPADVRRELLYVRIQENFSDYSARSSPRPPLTKWEAHSAKRLAVAAVRCRSSFVDGVHPVSKSAS
jgi:DNA-directed RNA polymerase specialized sigma24 family protein